MKKMRSRSGFTLIEMLMALLIMVFLITGIGVGMDAGMNIYREATFEADSATLAGTLNTNLGDILRYSQNVRENTGSFTDAEGNTLTAEDAGFVFTNLEYGIQDGYFSLPVKNGVTVGGVLQLKSLKSLATMELINSGSYPGLMVTDFEAVYVEPGTNSEGTAGRGGYFTITYVIRSENDDSLTRNVEYIVRIMNA